MTLAASLSVYVIVEASAAPSPFGVTVSGSAVMSATTSSASGPGASPIAPLAGVTSSPAVIAYV